MPVELTLENVIKAAEQAVAEKGEDFVYITPDGQSGNSEWSAPCKYIHGTNEDGSQIPGCIVGNIFIRMGYTIPEWFDSDGGRPASDLYLYLAEGKEWSQKISAFLGRMQNAQDHGRPWGFALERGKAMYQG